MVTEVSLLRHFIAELLKKVDELVTGDVIHDVGRHIVLNLSSVLEEARKLS